MHFSSRRLADVVVVVPSGRIDHANATEMERLLAPILDETAAGGTSIVFDFSGVEYVSSMGLRVLMVAAKRVRAEGARIAVTALQPVVEEIFGIARFQHVVEVFPSLPSALQRISEPALAAYTAAR
jgi:anti-anti-sigma factor